MENIYFNALLYRIYINHDIPMIAHVIPIYDCIEEYIYIYIYILGIDIWNLFDFNVLPIIEHKLYFAHFWK